MPTPKKATTSKRTTPKKVKPQNLAPTPASSWKGKAQILPHPLPLPSGNVCMVKRVGMESFLKGGVIPNSLLGVVQESMDNARKGKTMTKAQEVKLTKQISNDPQQLEDMLTLVDEVVLQVVVEPEVLRPPEEDSDEERDEDSLYVDEVDINDKMFIFNYVVGGSNDSARFREEAEQRVAALDDVEEAEVPAE
jgi:hypothetical protein